MTQSSESDGESDEPTPIPSALQPVEPQTRVRVWWTEEREWFVGTVLDVFAERDGKGVARWCVQVGYDDDNDDPAELYFQFFSGRGKVRWQAVGRSE